MFERLLIANDLSQASYSLMHCLEGLRDFGAEECLLVQCMDVKRPASRSVSFAKGVLENLLRNEKAVLEKKDTKLKQESSRVLPKTKYTGLPQKRIIP